MQRSAEGQHARYRELLDRMWEMHHAKGADYSGAQDTLRNLRECERFGVSAVLGTLVRMSDKWQRVTNLLGSGQGPAVKAESVKDTLLDLAAYSLLEILLIEETEARVE